MSEWQETDFGRIPAHWTISNVQEETEYVTDYVANGSFASLAENVSYKNTPDYAVLIRLTDYNNGFKGDFVYVDEHAYNFLKKSKLKGGEIIISNVGAYSGTVFLAPKLGIPMTLGPNAVMMEFKDGNDFYFHWLKSPAGQFSLEGIISGSAQPKFNKTSFRAMKIPVPPIEEQHAIASILSSLDDKIDLLHRQNQTLEQLAETLFRQWFVEDADESWEEGVLGDLVEVKYGKDHKKLLDGTIPIYGSGGLMRNAEKSLYEGESVLIPRKGTLNNVMYVNEAFWTVDTMFYTIMKREHLAKFIYQFIKQKDLASMNVGSAVPSMTTAVLNNMPIEIPPKEILDKFDYIVSELYDKIKSNQTQIHTLTALRDTLLPKLMSGEVRIETY
jgi:type I restriction enzyme S subunit